VSAAPPNPSLHPTCYSGLRPLPQAGELKRWAAAGHGIRLRRIVSHAHGRRDSAVPAPVAALYWTEEERGAFAAFIAEHPNAGDLVPESGGIRKVRWRRAGSGKSGGVRVIYFTRTAAGEVVLLTLYAKSKTDNLTGPKLKEIRRALEE
jgi:hypothetical protein